MTAFSLCMAIGWVALVASWIIPWTMKNKKISRIVAMILSAFAVGIFIANGIYILFK
jgi:hypothetical protein